jgi:hypothetical protein
MALPPQNLKIGSLELSKVVFVTLAGVQKSASPYEFDGLLPTGSCKRIFVSRHDHVAVLDPW